MTTATSLLASLGAAGISIRVEGGRLLVEAPRGTITPEIRAQLVNYKTELVATLEFAQRHRATDPTTGEALGEVAGLLATAYQRWRRIPRIPEVSGDALNAELALRAGESVHGREHP